MSLISNKRAITIYTPYNDTYIRNVVEDCIIRQDLELIFKSKGALPLDTVKIYIPMDKNYINEKDYYGIGWTVRAGQDNNASYITEGICSFDFSKYNKDNMPEAIRKFEREVKYKKPKFIKENFIIGGALNHLEVLC